MSIGEVLAEARCRSGLSINEVSRQTRIREAIIWGIELDNYALCGGDFYARGHIRAIASVVGVDSAPLIQEFDARRQEQEARRRSRADDEAGPLLLAPGQSSPSNPSSPSRPSNPSNPSRPPSRSARSGPPKLSERYRRRQRRRVVLTTALCLVILAIFGVEAYHFARDTSPSKEHAAQAAYNRASTRPHAKPTASKSQPAPSPSPTPAAPTGPVTLKPVSATAYGPYGSAGDNPQDAAMAIDASGATAWRSDWYSTPAFGNTQAGTGLLLDLGRDVTIDSAQIAIGTPGATVQLRAGTSPANLQVIGHDEYAGATAVIRPEEISVRYLLIWFTQLPPDSSGSYQAAVYNVALQGRP